MHNFTELVQMIQKITKRTLEASNPSRVLFGVVTKEDPLEINVEQKLPLSMKQLILSRNVTDFKTQISIGSSGAIQNATIYNKLKKGEEVILLQMQDGQKYIVWDRVIK